MTTITLDALLQDVAAARQRMSHKNPHRLLLQQCADALVQLALIRPHAGEPSLEMKDAPAQADPVGRLTR